MKAASSKKKRWAFGAVAVVLTYGFLELSALGIYTIVTGHWFSSQQFSQWRQDVVQEPTAIAPAGRSPQGVEIHPYLGFANGPITNELANAAKQDQHASGGADAFKVLIVGGSVAAAFFGDMQTELATQLAQVPGYGNRPIQVRSLAMAAYKQPQQLAAVSHYLVLGGRADLVINIDGYNELVSAVRNQRQLGDPVLPRFWNTLTADTVPPNVLKRVGQIQNLQDTRQTCATGAERLRWSIVSQVLWYFTDQALSRRVGRLRQKVLDMAADIPSTAAAPPEIPYEQLVAIWYRSSLQLHQLATAAGGRYLHVLQPNQYVKNSKPLSAEEAQHVVNTLHFRHEVVPKGYALLSAAGHRLQEQGVAFLDLTHVYAEVTDTVYIDDCCHLNELGNRLICEAIVAALYPDHN